MNTSNQNDGIMYKAAAFAIFVVLVTLIVLAAISSKYENEIPTPGTGKSDVDLSEVSNLPESSSKVNSDSLPTSNNLSSVDTNPPETSPKDTASSEVKNESVSDENAANAVDTSFETSSSGSNTPGNDPKAVSGQVDTPTSYTPENVANFLANYPNTVLSETEDAGQEYIDKITFLGDSTTYGLRANAVLNGGKNTTQVWTPTNGYITLSQVNTVLIWYPETNTEMSIKDAAALKKPEYLVITLGVNGISFMNEDYFKNEYGKLISSIKEASPDTKIILQSIFPVATNYESLKSINNELIDTANEWVVELAEEYEVKYVDTNSVLRGSDGWLVSSYQNGDGLHLTAEGLNIELNNLRTHAWID